MIETLHISNYALIDKVDITLHPGLNIITGETGAGKSIMLGALSLLMGGRADSKAIRDSGRKSVVEASFSGDSFAGMERFCRENDIDFDPERVILRREVSAGGRSRAFINDTPVTLTLLRDMSLHLVDIHSQHQNLLLASPPYQLRVLDSLAGNGDRLAVFGEAYARFRRAVKEYQLTRRRLEQTRREEAYLRHQYEQLEEARLVDGEQEELERERDLLSNMADIKTQLNIVLAALSEGEVNADSLLKEACDGAIQLSDLLEDADSLAERLESLRVECRDVAASFQDFDRSLSADPAQLEAIEERLNKIYDLERKHHTDTVAALIGIRDSIKAKLDAIDMGDESLRDLELAARKAKKESVELAREISEVRRREAERFAAILRERAVPLGMKNLQVEISVKDAELSATGIDQVEFLFAFNKNQPLLPVGNTASGGEISRLMLSIKSIVADKMELPSLIFDEVDTGVSGDVAGRMGQMMLSISGNIQVIAITHLPQVAAKGTVHFKVFKEDTDQATVTRIRQLSDDDRVDELAMMLSGSTDNAAARATACSLLGMPDQQRQTTLDF